MRLFGFALVIIFALLPFLSACTGCSRQEKSPEQIRQETANATAKLKSDTVAVAKGIKEGLTKESIVDLNSGSKAQLQTLPGIGDAQADKIIAARPYDNKDQLVTRHILSQGDFDRISGRVTVNK